MDDGAVVARYGGGGVVVDVGGAAMILAGDKRLPAPPVARPLLVYVAGPYTHGDVVMNVRAAVLAGLQIQQAGHLAFVPHYFHFAHFLVPHSYESWMVVDLRMLARCDLFLRLPGYSPGAHREEDRARVLGMTVYLSVESCLAALPRGEEVRDGADIY